MSKTLVKIFIPGTPVPKGRPRAARTAAGAVRTYTPGRTRDYERKLAYAVSQHYSGIPVSAPLSIDLGVALPVPGSWPLWKRTAALARVILPAGRPDLDNYLKTLDALNGLVWADDSQIVTLRVKKFYYPKPGLFVRVSALAALTPQATRKDMPAQGIK